MELESSEKRQGIVSEFSDNLDIQIGQGIVDASRTLAEGDCFKVSSKIAESPCGKHPVRRPTPRQQPAPFSIAGRGASIRRSVDRATTWHDQAENRDRGLPSVE